MANGNNEVQLLFNIFLVLVNVLKQRVQQIELFLFSSVKLRYLKYFFFPHHMCNSHTSVGIRIIDDRMPLPILL